MSVVFPLIMRTPPVDPAACAWAGRPVVVPAASWSWPVDGGRPSCPAGTRPVPAAAAGDDVPTAGQTETRPATGLPGRGASGAGSALQLVLHRAQEHLGGFADEVRV